MNNKKLTTIALFIIIAMIFNMLPIIGISLFMSLWGGILYIDQTPTYVMKEGDLWIIRIQDFFDTKAQFRKYVKYSFKHDWPVYLAFGVFLFKAIEWCRESIFDTRLTICFTGMIFGAYFFYSYIQAYKEMK